MANQFSYVVPSSDPAKPGYVINLQERGGKVIGADCGCVACMRYRKVCRHIKVAKRAHQRVINAGYLLREGMNPADVVDMLTEGRCSLADGQGAAHG